MAFPGRANGVRPYPEITCTEIHAFHARFGSALKKVRPDPVFGPRDMGRVQPKGLKCLPPQIGQDPLW